MVAAEGSTTTGAAAKTAAGWINPWTRLPEKLREAIVLLGIVAAVTLGWVSGLTYLPFLSAIERWVADYRIATLTPPEPQHPDIIVVGLTEETLELFPYRSPIDRKFIAELIQTLAARGVKAIMVDMLFDQPTEDDKDELLRATLADLKIPTVVSYGRQEDELTDVQVEYLDEFVGVGQRGFAFLPKDDIDATARWIYPGRKLPDGTYVRGVAGALAEKLGATPPAGQVRIAFRGRPDLETQPFRMFPAHAVPALPPAWFKDKIALIGADLSYTVGFADRHRTPFAAGPNVRAGMIPGVIIHGHALAQILDGRTSPEVGFNVQVALVAALALIGMVLGKLELPALARFSVAGVVILAGWVGGFVAFRYAYVLVPLVGPTLALLLAQWATDLHVGRQERQQRRFIQQAFTKYVSPELLKEILKDPTKLSLEAARKEVSIIFTDVAGFTTISEKLEAAVLADLLNRYLDGACKEIFKLGGTINQFTGDAIYAMFNAPADQPDHARRALTAAIKIDEFSERFIREERARGLDFGHTRIGVHTAVTNVGNFGSPDRFEYKALGDPVNTCSRLEGLNKYFETRMCVSHANARHSPEQPFRPIGHIVMKGKAEALLVLEPLSAERDASAAIAMYRRAYELMEKEDPGALTAFEALHAAHPEDGVAAFHIERLKAGETGSRVVMADK
jgi:class 3 adenylate cyclase